MLIGRRRARLSCRGQKFFDSSRNRLRVEMVRRDAPRRRRIVERPALARDVRDLLRGGTSAEGGSLRGVRRDPRGEDTRVRVEPDHPPPPSRPPEPGPEDRPPSRRDDRRRAREDAAQARRLEPPERLELFEAAAPDILGNDAETVLAVKEAGDPEVPQPPGSPVMSAGWQREPRPGTPWGTSSTFPRWSQASASRGRRSSTSCSRTSSCARSAAASSKRFGRRCCPTTAACSPVTGAKRCTGDRSVAASSTPAASLCSYFPAIGAGRSSCG